MTLRYLFRASKGEFEEVMVELYRPIEKAASASARRSGGSLPASRDHGVGGGQIPTASARRPTVFRHLYACAEL